MPAPAQRDLGSAAVLRRTCPPPVPHPAQRGGRLNITLGHQQSYHEIKAAQQLATMAVSPWFEKARRDGRMLVEGNATR
jgi:hypothetical protein